jgi:quinol monooxygenase YgiN
MIVLVVTLKVRPGASAQVETVLRGVVEKAAGEPGTLTYSLNRSLSEPDTLVLYERYADQAAADTHMNAPDLRAALGSLQALLAAPPQLSRLEEIFHHAKVF